MGIEHLLNKAPKCASRLHLGHGVAVYCDKDPDHEGVHGGTLPKWGTWTWVDFFSSVTTNGVVRRA